MIGLRTLLLSLIFFISVVFQPQLFAQNAEQKAERKRSSQRTCDKILRPRRIVDKSTPLHYRLSDGQFYVAAEVMNGDLYLDFRLKSKSGKRSSLLSGKEQFKKVLAYFQGKFNLIYAVWVDGDNLDQFNYLVATGYTLEQAALGTWTGKQAMAAGYSVPVVNKLMGVTGSYDVVSVEFRKP